MKSSKKTSPPSADRGDAIPITAPGKRSAVNIVKRQFSTGNALIGCSDEFDVTGHADNILRSTDDTTIKPGHKISSATISQSVPLSAAPRSRLASFNLPLFNTAPKNISFFSTNKRRESLCKALQKNQAQGNISKPETDCRDTVVIDMENEAEDKQQEEGKEENENAVVKAAQEDFGGNSSKGSFSSGGEQKHWRSWNKRTRETSESSGARGSMDRQSKTSVAENLLRASDIPRQRSRDMPAPDDAANLQRTERGLLNLLEDFNAGRMSAFGTSDTSTALRRVREMQEKLARAHFDLYALQEKIGFHNPKLANSSLSNWQSLMQNMQELSEAVQKLDPSNGTSGSNNLEADGITDTTTQK